MVSTRLLISKPSTPYTNLMVTVPSAAITIGITVVFMFHSFFCYLARPTYLSFFSLFFFSFALSSPGTAKWIFNRFFLFLFLWTFTISGHLLEIRWILCVSISRTDTELSIYHLFVLSNLNSLQNFLLITFSTQSFLVLYTLCTNLLFYCAIIKLVTSPH